jgi:hypothetical protein
VQVRQVREVRRAVGFDRFLIHEALVRSNPTNLSNPPNRQMLFA